MLTSYSMYPTKKLNTLNVDSFLASSIKKPFITAGLKLIIHHSFFMLLHMLLHFISKYHYPIKNIYQHRMQFINLTGQDLFT